MVPVYKDAKLLLKEWKHPVQKLDNLEQVDLFCSHSALEKDLHGISPLKHSISSYLPQTSKAPATVSRIYYNIVNVDAHCCK